MRLSQGSKRSKGCCCNLFYDDFESNTIGVPGNNYTAPNWTVASGIMSTSTANAPINLSYQINNNIFSYKTKVRASAQVGFLFARFKFLFGLNKVQILATNGGVLRECDYTLDFNTWYEIEIIMAHGTKLYIDGIFVTTFYSFDFSSDITILGTMGAFSNQGTVDIDYIEVEGTDEIYKTDDNILYRLERKSTAFNSQEELFCNEPFLKDWCWPIQEELATQMQVTISGDIGDGMDFCTVNCSDIPGTYVLDLVYQRGSDIYNDSDAKIKMQSWGNIGSPGVAEPLLVYSLDLPIPISGVESAPGCPAHYRNAEKMLLGIGLVEITSPGHNPCIVGVGIVDNYPDMAYGAPITVFGGMFSYSLDTSPPSGLFGSPKPMSYCSTEDVNAAMIEFNINLCSGNYTIEVAPL